MEIRTAHENLVNLTKFLVRTGFAQTKTMGKVNQLFSRQDKDGEITFLISLRTQTKYHSENSRSRVYAGHRIVIEKQCDLETRLAIAPRQSGLIFLEKYLFNLLGVSDLAPPSLTLSHLRIWTSEPEWALRYLAHTRVNELISTILIPAENSPKIVFTILPDRISLSTTKHMNNLTPLFAETMLGYLVELHDNAA